MKRWIKYTWISCKNYKIFNIHKTIYRIFKNYLWYVCRRGSKNFEQIIDTAKLNDINVSGQNIENSERLLFDSEKGSYNSSLVKLMKLKQTIEMACSL